MSTLQARAEVFLDIEVGRPRMKAFCRLCFFYRESFTGGGRVVRYVIEKKTYFSHRRHARLLPSKMLNFLALKDDCKSASACLMVG